MSSTQLNNGTGNRALGKDSVAIGQGAVAVGDKQTVLGRYPEIPTGDTSSDALIIGAGRSEFDRETVLRVTKEGEVLIGAGRPVLMKSPDTYELKEVYFVNQSRKTVKAHTK